jgi:hypothetical protein
MKPHADTAFTGLTMFKRMVSQRLLEIVRSSGHRVPIGRIGPSSRQCILSGTLIYDRVVH